MAAPTIRFTLGRGHVQMIARRSPILERPFVRSGIGGAAAADEVGMVEAEGLFAVYNIAPLIPHANNIRTSNCIRSNMPYAFIGKSRVNNHISDTCVELGYAINMVCNNDGNVECDELTYINGSSNIPMSKGGVGNVKPIVLLLALGILVFAFDAAFANDVFISTSRIIEEGWSSCKRYLLSDGVR
jgi:hypothetical protein